MKIPSTLLYTLTGTLIITLGACSKTGNCINATEARTEKTRLLNSFQFVEISAPADITLKQSPITNSVTINAPANIIDHIQTRTKKNRLYISMDKEVCRAGKISILVSGKTFNEINASGKLLIRTIGILETKEFALNLNGANTVQLDLVAEKMITDASGANEIILTGSVQQHSVNISGEGKIKDLTRK
jgi:hypothetical protein